MGQLYLLNLLRKWSCFAGQIWHRIADISSTNKKDIHLIIFLCSLAFIFFCSHSGTSSTIALFFLLMKHPAILAKKEKKNKTENFDLWKREQIFSKLRQFFRFWKELQFFSIDFFSFFQRKAGDCQLMLKYFSCRIIYLKDILALYGLLGVFNLLINFTNFIFVFKNSRFLQVTNASWKYGPQRIWNLLMCKVWLKIKYSKTL